jgi:hypothetical protein
MKKVVGNDLAGNGGSRLGQSSPVSTVAGEVREKKKKKKKNQGHALGVLILF